MCQNKPVGVIVEQWRGVFQNLRTNRTSRLGLTICNSVNFPLLFSADERLSDWKLENVADVKGLFVVPFRNEIKRTTSGGSQQFPSGFPGKLLFLLIFNQHFWIFGKMISNPYPASRVSFEPLVINPIEKYSFLQIISLYYK